MAMTAQDVVVRMQKQLGSSWKDSSVDTFMAGNKDVEVKGIVTTYAPSLEVLRTTVASGKNMIISRESPYWRRNSDGPEGGSQFSELPGSWPGGPVLFGRKDPPIDNDPTYQAKRDYIAANNLAVYRFLANWNARQPDAQLQALAKALNWDKYYKPSGGVPWGKNNGFFDLPPATLRATAQNIKKTLKMKSIRVGGHPDTVVRRAALSHGMYWLTDMQKLMAEPGVDLLVVGEPQWENELGPYIFDMADAGQKKGMIVLGQEVSEDPGCGAMAAWLKSFISEVPVQWIPTGEPTWMPY